MKARASDRWLELAASDGGTLTIRVVDVARARHLRLTLGRDGPRLSKPRWVSLRDAATFAAEKRGWLEERLAERETLPSLVQWPALVAGAAGSMPLRGECLQLRVASGRRPSLAGDGDGVVLTLPDRDSATLRRIASGLFRSWLEVEMRRDVATLLARHTAIMGRAPTRVGFRALRSLWGSLSTRDHLSLDLSLVLASPEVLEYVLVHELAHLFERNHGPRFWARVSDALPDFRERQRALHRDGEALKAALATLIGKTGQVDVAA
jgi:predicted metal-dependent hydrolase